MTEMLALESFSPHIDDTFRVVLPNATADLTLIEAKPLGEATSPGGRKPFSLLFRGAVDRGLEQQTFEIKHRDMGSFELFLVPMQPDDKGSYFEAVFS